MTTATVTRRLQGEGLPVQLVRGEGYHYFTYDTPTHFECESIYVPRFRDYAEAEWLQMGREFAAKTRAAMDARAALEAAEPNRFRLRFDASVDEGEA